MHVASSGSLPVAPPVAPPPPAPPALRFTSGVDPSELTPAFFTRALRAHAGRDDDAIVVTSATPFPLRGSGGILSALSSGRGARLLGLQPYALTWRRGHAHGTTRVVVKSKADDREMIGVINAFARLCGDPVGPLHDLHRFETGFRNCHLRELALGDFRHPAYLAIAAKTYATHRAEPRGEDRGGAYVLVLEHLEQVTHLDASTHAEPWRPPHVHAALRDLARFHAAFLGRAEDLIDRLHLEPLTAARAERLAPLWDALVVENAKNLPWAFTPTRVAKLRAAIAAAPRVWGRLEASERTLVHGDFNTRNACLRRAPGHPLCVYDWELATVHVPQRDVCDFLAYVLPPGTPQVRRLSYVEQYRQELERALGVHVRPAPFFETYALASIDYAVTRLLFLAIAHRFLDYPFFPRVLESHLEHLDTLGVEGGAPC